MNKIIKGIGAVLVFSLMQGCAEEGCTNSQALNFDVAADKDDGSCSYANMNATVICYLSESLLGSSGYTPIYWYADGKFFQATEGQAYFDVQPDCGYDNDDSVAVYEFKDKFTETHEVKITASYTHNTESPIYEKTITLDHDTDCYWVKVE